MYVCVVVEIGIVVGYGLAKVIWRLLVGLRKTQNIWAASKDRGRSISAQQPLKAAKRRDDTILRLPE